MITGHTLLLTVRGVSMKAFADGTLSQLAERTVIDQTGLSGLFDIHLQYTKDDETEFPSLSAALQEQLGLKLTAARGPVGVFIIDHVENPTAN